MKSQKLSHKLYIVWLIAIAILAVVLILAVILIAFGRSQALTSKVPDQDTLTWDLVMTIAGRDGNQQPISETDQVLYEVYLSSANRPIADRGDVSTLISQGSTETTQLNPSGLG